MNWKAFTAVCISVAIISFPRNIIGCGPEMDPYDYYTSFFHQNLPDAGGYRPFYYTGYNFLYDNSEPVTVSDLLAEEWAAYGAAPVTKADAKKLVNKFSSKDLNNLYYHIEKNQPLKLPDSVKQNSMTDYFIRSKDLEALGYILYAKQVEPYVVGDDDWQNINRDSLKMARLIKNGQQLYAAAKKDLIKQKYIYQVLRLAHYSGRYNEVINWYDEYQAAGFSNSVVAPLCTALKAGSLFRTGKTKEAAYLFSKAFSSSMAKRISNYLGFKWSVDPKTSMTDYLAYCKNNHEKASMLALFAFGSTGNDLDKFLEIYQLDPGCEELEVLAVREINKLEEKYFTPALQRESGGKAFYYTWDETSADSILAASEKEAKQLSSFLHDASQRNQVKNAGLFETAAAYAAYMTKDYGSAKKYLGTASKMQLTPKVKDQWALTNLLVSINEKQNIDAAFEEQLLPSLQWLEGRVRSEKPIDIDYWQVSQWQKIYRSLMSEILARRYHAQGELVKEALCIGNADWIMKGKDSEYGWKNGIEFLRNNMMSKDVEQLYALLMGKQSKFENYLISHNSVTKKEVADFAGTSYLREYNYSKAIEWFSKSVDKAVIGKNPFIELLYDREEQLPSETTFKTTKLAFAQQMLKLEQASKQSRVAANVYYKMALGTYNMTYYGHCWELVQYYRGGTDGYHIPKNATGFQKEYYGCYKAQEYFEKAMSASSDKNFRARCLFMMAKCSQKQLQQPQYEDYPNNWEQYDKDYNTVYWPAFMKNNYFPELVKNYSNTTFYKEAFNSCSYLRDFVKKK